MQPAANALSHSNIFCQSTVDDRSAAWQVAFASAPTWMVYAGDHEHCMDSIPLAVSRGQFCRHYQGSARVFRLYAPWVLAMLLTHGNMQLHSYPEVMFRAANWTMSGQANCGLDTAPQVRASAVPAHMPAHAVIFRFRCLITHCNGACHDDVGES